MNDLRIVSPAVAAWLTALACTQSRSVPVLIGVVLGGGAIALLAAAARTGSRRGLSRTLSTVAVCLALSAAVATGVSASSHLRTPDSLERAADTASLLDIRADVSGSPIALGGASERVVVDVTITGAASRQSRDTGLSVPAVLFVGADEDLRIGDTLELTARIQQGRTGDREAYLVTDVGGHVTRTPAPPVIDTAAGLRAAFVDLAGQFPGDGGPLLPGLAVGDTSLVDDELTDRMTAASLSHLTAVSGANCALVVGAVLGALALCGSPRWVRVAGSLLALGGFVILVTPEPSVVRASVMAAIVLVCEGIGRRSLGASVLFLAVVVCLLIDPWLSREFGFALSVAATAGLLFLAGPLTTVLQKIMPLWLAGAVALPLAAQLACQPIIVLLDPSVPLWGVPANMLAAPAAPIVTILGMSACLLLPVLPGLANVLAVLAWLPSQWIAGVAAATEAAPLARLPGAPGVAGVLSASVVLVLVAMLAGSRSPSTRRWVSSALAVAACGYLAVLGGARVGELWSRPDDWSVAMCDVGQGDAVLVRSDDRMALIDTGPDPDALDRCLDDLGIGRIQLLVLSHFDADHVGGVDAVAGRVDTVLHQPLREPADRALIARAVAAGAAAHEATVGSSGDLGALPWRVLWPPPEPSSYTGNDGSVVIEFGGGVDALFLGDLGADSELALLAEGTVGSDYAIVKFAHHGSADQYDPLYERIRAVLALISCGLDNDYGHPAPSSLTLLSRVGTSVARSDQDGTTLVSLRAGELETWSSGPSGDPAGPSG